MSKSILVVGSTNNFRGMVEKGIRVGANVLSEQQSKKLVKAALKQLPDWQAKEVESHLFAGHKKEPISVAAICKLAPVLQSIVADPVRLQSVLA
jgi:hypothetical protein